MLLASNSMIQFFLLSFLLTEFRGTSQPINWLIDSDWNFSFADEADMSFADASKLPDDLLLKFSDFHVPVSTLADSKVDVESPLSFSGAELLVDDLCPVCSDKVSGYHYGLQTCESCKG